METIHKTEHRENRKKQNQKTVEAMTDEELAEIKALINAEQSMRMKEAIERLGT
jgi:hypothetical protein